MPKTLNKKKGSLGWWSRCTPKAWVPGGGTIWLTLKAPVNLSSNSDSALWKVADQGMSTEVIQCSYHELVVTKFRLKESTETHKLIQVCGSDHELLIAKFRLKLKKVGKTTRPFRYDLNQIPYDYTVEVRNRYKGLDLIDRVPDELWNEVHDIV